MFKKSSSISNLLLASLFLAACAETSPSGGYDSALNRKTAGAGVISGFAKLCGGKGIEKYRQSFIDTMKSEREISPEVEAKIRSQFEYVDNSIAKTFADPAARKKQCTDYPLKQSVINRGISGDFTGQI
jgi:predicted secreted protein